MKWLYLFMLPLVSAQLDPVADLATICSTDHARIVNTVTYPSVVVYTCMCNQHYELTQGVTPTGIGSWTYNDQIEGMSNSQDSTTFQTWSECTCIPGKPCDTSAEEEVEESGDEVEDVEESDSGDEIEEIEEVEEVEDGEEVDEEVSLCDDHPCGDNQECATNHENTQFVCICQEHFGGQDEFNERATCHPIRCDDANGDGMTGDPVDCIDEHATCTNDEDAGFGCECPQGFTGGSMNTGTDCTCHGEVVVIEGKTVCQPVEEETETEEPDTLDEPDACAKDEYVKNNTCEKCGAISGNKAGDLVAGEDTACDVKAWFVVLMSVLGVGAVALTVFLVQNYAPERAKRFIYNPV